MTLTLGRPSVTLMLCQLCQASPAPGQEGGEGWRHSYTIDKQGLVAATGDYYYVGTHLVRQIDWIQPYEVFGLLPVQHSVTVVFH